MPRAAGDRPHWRVGAGGRRYTRAHAPLRHHRRTEHLAPVGIGHADDRGVREPREVTPRTLRGFLAHLDDRGLARTTIQRKLSAVRSLFKLLLEQGFVDAHPAAGLRQARTQRKLPTHLETGEIERLLEAPDVTTPAGRRDRALLDAAILFETACHLPRA